MESLLNTFGIDWRLLLINAINFGLLLVGLRYFLYGPLMNMLETRRQAVVRGVEAAAAAERRLQEIESTRAQKLAEAGKEAQELLVRARAAAAEKQQELLKEAQGSAASVIKEAEGEAQALKERALAESKKEIAKLIVLGIEKSLK